MPVDANIPLQAQAPQVPDFTQNVAKAYQLKDLILGEQQKEQDMQRQSALRDIFSKADTSTPEGQAKLVQDVAKVDPTQAMAIQKNYTDIALTKAKTDQALTTMKSEQFDILKKRTDATSQALATIDTAAQGPMGKDPAAMNALYHHQLQSLSEQGILTPDDLKRMPPNYDPNWVHAKSMENKDHVDMLDKAQQRRQEQQRIGIEGYRASTEARQGEERIGIERQRLAQEGWEVKQSTDPTTGESTYTRVNKITGQTAPVEGVQGKDSGRMGSAIQQRYTQQLISTGEDLKDSLNTLKNTPFGTTSMFGHEDSHGGLFKAGIEKYLANKITTDSARQMDQNMGDFKRIVAQALSGGGRVTEGAVKSLDSLTIKPGDTIGDAQNAVANGANIVRNALKAIDTSKMPAEQKKKIQDIQDAIKDVPTPAELARAKYGNVEGEGAVPSKSGKSGGEDYSSFWSQ